MLKYDVQQHVDISPVALCDQAGEPREPVERIGGIGDVRRFNGEEIRWIVSPTESPVVWPGNPGHEFYRVHLERLNQVESILNGINGSARPTIFLSEIVDH